MSFEYLNVLDGVERLLNEHTKLIGVGRVIEYPVLHSSLISTDSWIFVNGLCDIAIHNRLKQLEYKSSQFHGPNRSKDKTLKASHHYHMINDLMHLSSVCICSNGTLNQLPMIYYEYHLKEEVKDRRRFDPFLCVPTERRSAKNASLPYGVIYKKFRTSIGTCWRSMFKYDEKLGLHVNFIARNITRKCNPRTSSAIAYSVKFLFNCLKHSSFSDDSYHAISHLLITIIRYLVTRSNIVGSTTINKEEKEESKKYVRTPHFGMVALVNLLDCHATSEVILLPMFYQVKRGFILNHTEMRGISISVTNIRYIACNGDMTASELSKLKEWLFCLKKRKIFV
jgi:hypothetical protein